MMPSRLAPAVSLLLVLAASLPAEPMILTVEGASTREKSLEAKLAGLERRLAEIESLLSMKSAGTARQAAGGKAGSIDPASLGRPGQQARIVVDLDGDGTVAGVGPDGDGRDGVILVGTAETGGKDPWEPARAYDLNEDGVLDGRDPSFRTLQIWVDENRDSLPQGSEIKPMEAYALTALVLPQGGRPSAVLGQGSKRSLASVGWF